MNRTLCGFAAAIVMAVATSASAVEIRYTHGVDTDSAHHWLAERFKKYVEDYSDGEVTVRIYPDSQLGSEQRGFQDVQNQVVQASSLAVNNATVFTESVGFFDLPYIFTTREEFHLVVDELMDDLNEAMIAESGNRAIMWFDQGFRHLTTSERAGPVRNIDDIQDMTIRVPPNPLMLGAFEAWGANPTPIAWDETFNALQQGVADGQENPHSVNRAARFDEVQKYITDLHYKLWIGPVVVNEDWLNGLDAAHREAIIRAGRDAMRDQRAEQDRIDQEALEYLIDRGMEHVGPLEDEDIWIEKTLAIWPDFFDEIGGTDLLERAMAVMGRSDEMPETD